MKLYTEADLRDFIDRNGCIVESDLDEKQLTPIELPSDEEIHRHATDYSFNYYEYRAGAKMVMSKIGGGNNSGTSNKTHLCLGFTPSFQPSPKVGTIENVPCKECGRYLYQHPSVSYTIENKKGNK